MGSGRTLNTEHENKKYQLRIPFFWCIDKIFISIYLFHAEQPNSIFTHLDGDFVVFYSIFNSVTWPSPEWHNFGGKRLNEIEIVLVRFVDVG